MFRECYVALYPVYILFIVLDYFSVTMSQFGLNLNPKQSDILGIATRRTEMQSDTNNSVKKQEWLQENTGGVFEGGGVFPREQTFSETLLLPKLYIDPGGSKNKDSSK